MTELGTLFETGFEMEFEKEAKRSMMYGLGRWSRILEVEHFVALA